MNTYSHLTPKMVRAREGQCLQLRGETRHQILDSQGTDGAFSLSRSRFQTGAGSPLHVHTREDEWFWVQSGEFKFQVGEDMHSVSAGDFIFGPRNMPHCYTCQSEGGGALLIGVVDAGFENFFREIAKNEGENGDWPGPHQMRDLAARYGVLFDSFDTIEPAVAPKIVLSGKGECLEAFGDCVRVLLSSDESAGRCCVVETETPSFMGPPPHVHENESEMFFVRSGRYEFQLGDARVQTEPGDVVFAPRCVPHTFRVVSSEPGRLLILAAPGGFDMFFRECAQLFESGQAPPESLTSIAASHGISFLPPVV